MSEEPKQVERAPRRKSQRVWLMLFVLVAVAAYVFSPWGPLGAASDWPTDFNAALQASAKSGKPVLIDFSAPG